MENSLRTQNYAIRVKSKWQGTRKIYYFFIIILEH